MRACHKFHSFRDVTHLTCPFGRQSWWMRAPLQGRPDSLFGPRRDLNLIRKTKLETRGPAPLNKRVVIVTVAFSPDLILPNYLSSSRAGPRRLLQLYGVAALPLCARLVQET